MSDMNELNEAGGQKCPECGKQTLAYGEFSLVEPQSRAILQVRRWVGVDCEHGYLQIIAYHGRGG